MNPVRNHQLAADAQRFKVAMDVFELGVAQHGPTSKLPIAECSICQERRNAVEELFEEMVRKCLLLAKLAADGPEFFNPLVAFEAQRIRDEILAGERRESPENVPSLEGAGAP